MGSIGPQDGAEANLFVTDAKSDYVVKEQPLGTLRRVRIITIGAGMSGINMIRTLRLNVRNFEHVVYEKNEKIGGTWFENRYPGCACDIPSHNYQFSHTPNPEWSSLFSESGEIQSYLQHVCDKHGLMEYIKLSHSVQQAQWDEGSGKWILKVKDEAAGTTFEDRCDFLLDASGILKSVNLLGPLCLLTLLLVIGSGLISKDCILSREISFILQDGQKILTIPRRRLL
jgi:hypothetical protein